MTTQRPDRFAAFAALPDVGFPLRRLPVYAEVVWEGPPPSPPPPDDRFAEPTLAALADVDDACHGEDACIASIERSVAAHIAASVAQAARDALLAAGDAPRELIADTIRRALDALGRDSLRGVDAETASAALAAALAAEAARRELARPETVERLRPLRRAHPLGLLATDHVGYVSFDLTRLPAEIRDALAERMAWLLDPLPPVADAAPGATILAYPLGLRHLALDALVQRRFADDAIVMRIEVEISDLPPEVANLGLAAMQDPGLVDWRLSPGSFASNPGALIGADGCETLLPADTALHEFNFHQVVGLGPDEVDLGLNDDLRARVRPAFVNTFRLSLIPVGHSLGQILYSFPLAPGESVDFAVIDWTRRDSTLRNEDTRLDESLVHELRRDRVISETVRAGVTEVQKGSSFMAGLAYSVGGAVGTGGFGAAAGLSAALGGTTATSRGSRDIAADTVQRLSDNVAQAASASREINSTIVVQSAQAEHEAIETRTVVNYNHSHALTVLYYEVLRHYRLTVEFAGRRPAILAKAHSGLTHLVKAGGAQRLAPDWTRVRVNRAPIEAALLDPTQKDNLDAVQRKWRRELEATARKALPAPGAPPGPTAFRYFWFEMRTGGIPVSEDYDLQISATIIRNDGAARGILTVNGNRRISTPGAFFATDNTYWFAAAVDAPEPMPWDRIEAFDVLADLTEGDKRDSQVSISFIRIAGVDLNGVEVILFERAFDAGHIVIGNDWSLLLPTRRPAPAPPWAGPAADIVDDEVRILALEEHLMSRLAHYEGAARLGLPDAQRASDLAALALPDGRTLLDKVDNRPLEVVGDFVAYPCTDAGWSDQILAAYERLELDAIPARERLLALPTRGVFAEAKLGHCNASEEIDNSRFWDWQSSPIPHMAPEIAPVQPVTPQPGAQDATPSAFPTSLLNIVNPPSAPDPQGMTVALTALATANIFRDMSGQAQLTDLLKKLSDNSVAIAGAAQRAPSAGQGAPAGQTPSPAPTPTPAPTSAPSVPPPPQTPEQQQSTRAEVQQKQIDIGKQLPIPQRRQIEKKVAADIVDARDWNISVVSKWKGDTIEAPVDASFSATAYFDRNTPAGGLYLQTQSVNTVAVWTLRHDGSPTHVSVHATEIKPVAFDLSLSVPGLVLDGLTLKADTYRVPLTTVGRTLPDSYSATAILDKAKLDAANPTVKLEGTLVIGKRDIEVTFKVGAGGELAGDLTRAFEASGTIEIVKLAATAALKAATKVTVNGEAAVKATVEVQFVKGYELKHV